MKKTLAVLALLAVVVAGAAAQTYYGIGVGMQTTTAHLLADGKLKTTAIALNVDTVVGNTICVVFSSSISMPNRLAVYNSDGSLYNEGALGSHIDIRFGADMLAALAYRFVFGQAELLVGAGAGINLLQLMSSTEVSGFQFMNFGFGGFATAAINLSPNFQLYGGVRYLYAPEILIATRMEGTGFSVATTFTPHVGLKIRTR